MTSINTTHSAPHGFFDRIEAGFMTLKIRWTQHNMYRRTLHELQELSDRELADLGLARSSLRAVALEAAEKA